MRLVGIIILILIGLFIFLFPIVNTERMCYVNGDQRISDIRSNALWRGWDQRMVCESRMDAIFNLESCVQNATKSSTIAPYAATLIQKLVFIIRPSTTGISALKSDHNKECVNFDWSLLP